MRDCISHVFSRVILQVRNSNKQMCHFCNVFSYKNSGIRKLVLYVFCRIFRRFGRFVYHSAYSIQHQFWVWCVFPLFFWRFMHSQWEALCVYVFNRRWKVCIFSRFSTCRRRTACVFSYFLAVGWPRLADLAGWDGLRWLTAWLTGWLSGLVSGWLRCLADWLAG